MVSITTTQIINALLALAKLPPGELAGAESIAEKIGAPKNYLSKVLQRLAHEGLVISQKGRHGGFRLAKAPSEISLYAVVEAVEDVSRWQKCFMGRAQCSSSAFCSAHQRWGQVKAMYIDFLNTTTIADL